MNLDPAAAPGERIELAFQARWAFLEGLLLGLPALVQGAVEGARVLASQAAEPALALKRRDLVLDLPPQAGAWEGTVRARLQQAQRDLRRPALVAPPRLDVDIPLSLVDELEVDKDMRADRLAQSLEDGVGAPYTELMARLQALGMPVQAAPAGTLARDEEVLRLSWLAHRLVESWQMAGLKAGQWTTLQPVLHRLIANWAQDAHARANASLVKHGVQAQADWRPYIKRSPSSSTAGGAGLTGARAGLGGGGGPSGASHALGPTNPPGQAGRSAAVGPLGQAGWRPSGPATWAAAWAGAGAGMPPGAPGSAPAPISAAQALPQAVQGRAQALLRELSRVVGVQVPDFASPLAWPSGQASQAAGPGLRAQPTSQSSGAGQGGSQGSQGGLQSATVGPSHGSTHSPPDHAPHNPSHASPAGLLGQAAGGGGGAPVSLTLLQAMEQLSRALAQAPQAGQAGEGVNAQQANQAALDALQEGKRQLKQAAANPKERATIEIVALLFQSILMEERLPASIRVWFARLQMPVLRVAVSEPDFFATVNHPARRLIDRMGTCVMGFEGGEHRGEDALHAEIKRVVQVVEAYPDTGRRVFETVLNEFERFLKTYFRDDNRASRKGVSLAQQVEQRETWAIQYTIELRKMLHDMPVHDGVRDFLFRVWADVLAHSAVQSGQASEETRSLKRVAADLIWSASAKTSREDRAEVLRRLPPLLKTLREGMQRAGLAEAAQEGHLKTLNTALAAAFTARAAALSAAHLQALTQRLEALDELLPDAGSIELDVQTLRDISGQETTDLEIVAEGGTSPTPAMLSWAAELQLGAWFELDYRGRRETVQLAWQGLQHQLSLFVTAQERGVLFQAHRLASFLQAGLLVPLEVESLTTRATRQALAKLDADPQRLLN